MKKLLTVIIILSVVNSIFARDFYSEFDTGMRVGNFEEVSQILIDWEKASPDNPEMFIAYFNYYLYRNVTSVPTKGQMDDGTNGYYSKSVYDNDDVFIGISYLDKALEKNPSRLDIHFGKCSSLLRSDNFKEASAAIVDLLKTSKEVNNMWLWTNNEPMVKKSTDGETQLFYGINDYCATLFNNFDITESYLKYIFNATEELYPNNIIGLNLSARYYLRISDFDKAISLLETAVRLDKTDYIVLGNLGYIYEMTNNYEKAKECYERMLSIDDQNAKQHGQQSLSALEEKM